MAAWTAGQQVTAAGFNAAFVTANVNVVTTSGTGQTLPDPKTFSASRISLTATCTLVMPTAVDGLQFYIWVQQAATGGPYPVPIPGVTWVSGVAPTMTTSASKYDWYQFVARGSTWLGLVLGSGMS